jgi:hypothetical protein
MQAHEFTLVLAGVAELTSELADAVYEFMGDDIEFGTYEGIALLHVRRAAPTLREAITGAIADVHRANLGIRVVRVESDTANTIAKINAELLGVATSAERE